jgi:hypothetical protein
MEKIMSKTNDTSRLATLENHDTLADSELAEVTGGGASAGALGYTIHIPIGLPVLPLPRPVR